jgi:hypothetical protein
MSHQLEWHAPQNSIESVASRRLGSKMRLSPASQVGIPAARISPSMAATCLAPGPWHASHETPRRIFEVSADIAKLRRWHDTGDNAPSVLRRPGEPWLLPDCGERPARDPAVMRVFWQKLLAIGPILAYVRNRKRLRRSLSGYLRRLPAATPCCATVCFRLASAVGSLRAHWSWLFWQKR